MGDQAARRQPAPDSFLRAAVLARRLALSKHVGPGGGLTIGGGSTDAVGDPPKHFCDQLKSWSGSMLTTEPTLYVIYIAATPERVWEALTSGDLSSRYFFGRRVESDWRVGSQWHLRLE